MSGLSGWFWACCVRCPWLLQAEWNGHYERHFFFFFILGLLNFASAPNFFSGDPPALYYIWPVKVGDKTCSRLLKLCVWLLRGWGRCLKGTLQKYARNFFRWYWWGAEWSVACAPAEIFNIELEFILLKLCTGGTSVSDISIYSGVYDNNDRIVA